MALGLWTLTVRRRRGRVWAAERKEDEKERWKRGKRKYEWRREEVEEKEKEEEDNEVECKGWGTSGMLALLSLCVYECVCECVCESKHPAMSQWVRHAQLLQLSITHPQTALKLTLLLSLWFSLFLSLSDTLWFAIFLEAPHKQLQWM